MTYNVFSETLNPTQSTIKTRSKFGNVSVTVTEACRWQAGGLHTGWLGVVNTRSQLVARRRLNAGWLTCGYSRGQQDRRVQGRSP